MNSHKYRPLLFYVRCFLTTWAFWGSAIFLQKYDKKISLTLLLLGLISPAFVSIMTVFLSKNTSLKSDFKRKFSISRISVSNILIAIATFFAIVVISVLISLAFGQSISQLTFTNDFTFSISGFSALLTILLASVIEEIGWRGYGEDAIAAYCSWFKESIIFGAVWSLWHLPLFWVSGTYHFMLKELGIFYMLNFLISVMPLGFLTTWVYVKNNRSILASVIFHIFVNLMQERIGLSAQTKCIETFVLIIFAIAIVKHNKDIFIKKLDRLDTTVQSKSAAIASSRPKRQ